MNNQEWFSALINQSINWGDLGAYDPRKREIEIMLREFGKFLENMPEELKNSPNRLPLLQALNDLVLYLTLPPMYVYDSYSFRFHESYVNKLEKSTGNISFYFKSLFVIPV